jgi:hypothetical protein
MNKTGYQPMPVLLRAEPNDVRWTSGSAKILTVVATLGTLLTLCGAVAICWIGFNGSPRKTIEKAPVAVPVLPEARTAPAAAPVVPEATTAPVAVATSHQEGASMPLPDSNQSDHSILDQPAMAAPNPNPTVAPALQTESSANQTELLKGERPQTGQIQTNPDRHLTEAMRKKLEKVRLAAERKRSQLEASYREHAISSEAYKKGEEKYQKTIERYRREMNAGAGPKKDLAGQN